MRILLVEDDPKIALFIIKGLKAEGFAVDHAANDRYHASQTGRPGIDREDAAGKE
jgi:DNA-binding response OmpR family regulator